MCNCQSNRNNAYYTRINCVYQKLCISKVILILFCEIHVQESKQKALSQSLSLYIYAWITTVLYSFDLMTAVLDSLKILKRYIAICYGFNDSFCSFSKDLV